MTQAFVANRLDIEAFAKAAGSLSGSDLFPKFPRLLEEAGKKGGDRTVDWQVQGEIKSGASGVAQVWLRVRASALLPLTCQRCLEPADIAVSVDRKFRFVETEEQAETEDEDAEEDVLALSRDFNLLELIEDELLMALPVVARHEVCPLDVKLAVQDPDFEAVSGAKANPFAALGRLKIGKSS